MTSDEQWMQRAVQLAERGRGFVEPNPLVGAVIVRGHQLIAEGWHQRYGEAHAEVNALSAAGESARGATLYVTLEPCCHHGKTPPCTHAVIGAGIGRVVAAMLDPFPQVSGQGADELRRAGISVDVGIGEAAARKLNAPYLKLLRTGRPYVQAKWAMTLDGKIATRSGDSKWISSEASRRRAHELRGRMDAIVVGIGTVLADNPMLTARPPGPRIASRVVLDAVARTPASSFLAQTARSAPTLIVAGTDYSKENQRILKDMGCDFLSLPVDARGWPRVSDLLDELGRRRLTNVLIEGGSEVLGSFFDASAVDEVHVFIAPRVAGGREAKTPVAGNGIERLAAALRLSECTIETLDGDIVLHGVI